jgi:hypothetical protein
MATVTEQKAIVKRAAVQAAVQAESPAAGAGGQAIRDQVEELARAVARQLPLAALEDEVNNDLQRDRYQRRGEFRGYRNSTTPRRLTLGSGTVPLDVPRPPHKGAERRPARVGLPRPPFLRVPSARSPPAPDACPLRPAPYNSPHVGARAERLPRGNRGSGLRDRS